MNDKPYQEPTGPNQGLPMLGWSGGSQAQPGQLAIGTGVVADQTPLQRQARTNYASASLIRVKYNIEECKEE